MINIETAGATGYLTLNRPDALNVLNLEMINQLSDGLARHLDNSAVRQIVVRGAGPGAFCAGGDVKHIRELVLHGELENAAGFFEKEYSLNLAIANCTKPYLSIIDGVAMGGGVGIAIHGSHRVVTERAVLAMPETAIGLFPDVGGSYFLPRLANRSGYWMGLTAARVKGGEAVTVGLATSYMPSDNVPELLQKLEDGEDINGAVAGCAETINNDKFGQQLETVEQVFSANNLEVIRRRLQDAREEFSDNRLLSVAMKGIQRGSPNSQKVTLDLLDAGATLPIAECLEQEYDAVIKIIQHPDFLEGVRAVLVDKDHKPVWR